jgi:sarcosine oxidase subunit gamma
VAELERRSALDGHYETGTFGAKGPGAPGVTLREQRPQAMAQVNGAPEESALAAHFASRSLDRAPMPLTAFRGEDVTMLWTGPGQWLAVSDTLEPPALVAMLEDMLAPGGATVSDLSHARMVLRVSGVNWRDLLAKGCPADVDAMAPGDCLLSLLGHFNVLVHCLAADSCDLYVFRSFGLSLWEWLTDAAEEFGYYVQSVDVE